MILSPRHAIAATILTLLFSSSVADADRLDELRKSSKHQPRDPAAALELGLTLRRAGLFDESALVLRRGYLYGARGELGAKLRWETTQALAEAGKHKAMLRECRSLLRVSRAKYEACAANAYLVWRRATRALPRAENALKLAPNDYDALLAKGRSLEQLGRSSEAEPVLRAAISADSSRYEAHRYLAELRLSKGQRKAAISDMRDACRLAPQEPEPRLLLAQMLPAGSEALRVLEEAIAIRPNYGAAFGLKGQILLKLGQTARAEQWLRKAIALDSQHADWHASLGRALVIQKKHGEALNEAKAALDLVKNHAGAKLVEADALAARGEIDLAIQAYQDAYSLKRDSATPLVHGARAALEGNRPTSAKAFADLAITDFPKWAPAWEVAGDVASHAGKSRAARAAYRRALKCKGPVNKAKLRSKLKGVK